PDRIFLSRHGSLQPISIVVGLLSIIYFEPHPLPIPLQLGTKINGNLPCTYPSDHENILFAARASAIPNLSDVLRRSFNRNLVRFCLPDKHNSSASLWPDNTG
ncbi:MAG: hypothetical protein WBO11_10675, partial [Nitrospira sp.]